MVDDKDKPTEESWKVVEESGLKSIKVRTHVAVNILIIELEDGRRFRVEAQEIFK